MKGAPAQARPARTCRYARDLRADIPAADKRKRLAEVGEWLVRCQTGFLTKLRARAWRWLFSQALNASPGAQAYP